MSAYWLKRFFSAIILLVVITFFSFCMMKMAPGDPTSMMMDPKIKAADLIQLRKNMGLDQPLVFQYLLWCKQLLSGNFGYSLITGQPVLDAIQERLFPTLLLSLSSFVLMLCITFPLGLLAGSLKDKFIDHFITILTFIGYSLPLFWLGLILILLFSFQLGWFPTSGFMDVEMMDASLAMKTLNVLKHLALPLLATLIVSCAGLTRYHRFSIISILNQPYIQAAKARGLSFKRILFKHAFKNAALPFITLLGLQLPGLIEGSFIIEYVFAWPGLGQLGVQAVFSRDYPIIMATLLFSAILILLGNALADLAYSLTDPRIRKPE